MNKDRMKEIGQKLLHRIDLVTLGVLLALLAVMGWLYIREQGYTPEQIEASSPAPLKNELDENESVKEIVNNFVAVNPDISQDEVVRRAVQNNMFDRKSVEEQAAIQKELNEQYNRAEGMFNRGQVPQARQLLEQILQRDPNHGPATELMKRITAPEDGADAGE